MTAERNVFKRLAGLWLVVALALPGLARATILYSVNATTDKLVTIETSTRVITEIGALGLDIGVTDGLAFAGAGNLYATLRIAGDSQDDFYRIDPATGHATLVKQNYVGLAEGMATRPGDGALFISHGASGNSQSLSTVDPATGIVTGVGSIGQDTDAMAFRADGTLFGEDVTLSGTPAKSLFYTIDPTSGTKTNLGTVITTDYNLNGMAFGNDGVLYGIMNDVRGTGSYLAEITIGTGSPAITTLGQLSADSLTDLAARPPSSTPEPATVALLVLGIGVVGLGIGRRTAAA